MMGAMKTKFCTEHIASTAPVMRDEDGCRRLKHARQHGNDAMEENHAN
jgi:hypothetical protein